MPPWVRHALAMVALAVSMSGVAFGQTVCDRLLPIGLVPPAGGFVPGCAFRYILLQGTTPGYVPLDYPTCPIGPCAPLTPPLRFVCEATHGYACCIAVGDSIPIVPGIYAGALRSGLSQRFANDTDTRADICASEYLGNGTRLCNVPLTIAIGAGMSRVQVTGVVQVFVVRPPAGAADLVVEFVAGPTPVRGATWARTKIRYR